MVGYRPINCFFNLTAIVLSYYEKCIYMFKSILLTLLACLENTIIV